MSNENKILFTHWCLLVGVVLALIYWFIESILDAAVFHGRDFSLELLYLGDGSELWLRAFVAGMFVFFGIALDFVLKHLRDSQQEQNRLIEQMKKHTHDLQERIKELKFFYGIDEISKNEETTIEEILEGTTLLIPTSWQYPEITEVRITYKGTKYATKNFKKTRWRQSAEIIVDRRPAGAIEVCYTREMADEYEGPFLKEERNLIDSIAMRLARIIQRKQAVLALRESEARFEQLSKTDGLTGLLNRRGWNECLADEEHRAQRHGHSCCVIIADLDGLKEVNDRQGHAIGDELIRRSAACIQGEVRTIDKVARIGGDEFAILAIECGEHAANTIMDRIEAAWSVAGIRVSWGMAMRDPNSGLQQAMAEADRLMYEMKGNHRKRRSISV